MTTASKPITIRPACQVPQWDEFIARHPGGSVFDTTAMIHAFQNTDDYEPLSLAAVNHHDEIVGLLVAVKISMARMWPTLVTSRSIFVTVHGLRP